MKKTSRAIIFHNDKLIVLYRSKKKNGKRINYYAIPGGHVEKGETLEETVKREIMEELNVEIELLGYLGKICNEKQCDYYFGAKIVSGEPMLGGEELEKNSSDNYYEVRYLPLETIDSYGIFSIDYVRNAINGKYEN